MKGGSARGSGSRISVSYSTSFCSVLGSRGLAKGMAQDLAGMGGIQYKETMQSLNNRLASYLDRARGLETKNQRLESKIREHLDKKGPQVRDWGHYFKTIEDLRAQIFANTMNNACIILQINSARLGADDFRVKYETELAMCQSVESNIHGLCKVIDDTREPLRGSKRPTSLTRSRLIVEVDALKYQDLAKILADIQAQYDKLAQKNQEELDKYWSQQIEESTTVSEGGGGPLGPADIEQLNRILLHLDLELAQTRKEGQGQAQKYEALLNIKVKLKAENTTCHHLLKDNKDFNIGDALDSSNSIHTIQKTTIPWIVDGRMVSKTSDTKVLVHRASRSRELLNIADGEIKDFAPPILQSNMVYRQ
ncbi:Keratin, type I cytoskeletal 18, partial [Plecturocebus cupreus]